ncbi:DNA polymerase III subunit beta [Pasteurellaceae bacterium HPA106]|uniref:DNA polymerase III subunit beta n=1 Tax=Spirabiliibacterium pneumoniae TaxID=221400 RepID=UPI001AAD3D8F|nr:DNA polymerase III subunit beta [Spirabiliibacterium pneumoniae]MBE2896354.1 DNA polymerase III subunit beta [Spirabiliibacterium pneumoniae]
MQFSISRENLIKPLQQVCGVLNSRPPTAVLHNLLLQIDAQRLIMTGTDLEVELSTQSPLQSASQDGFYTIPGKKFLDICRSFPDDALIDVTFEDDRAVISSGRSRFTLSTLPASDYPSLTDWQAEVDFTVAQDTLIRLIDATQFSMANQDARYFLNGMKFETEGNLLRTIATDGHRLAVCTMALEQPLPNHAVIVPRKGVLELKRLLNEPEEQVRIQIGTSNIRVQFEHTVFTSKLIDGRFPDYRRVLPRNADHIIEADWTVLKQAFTRAAILSSERMHGVRLALSPNQMAITSSNAEKDVVEEVLDIQYDNEEMEISFNVNYLLDVLNALKCDKVRFRFSDANSSCLLEDCNDSYAEYVIMPMRL